MRPLSLLLLAGVGALVWRRRARPARQDTGGAAPESGLPVHPSWEGHELPGEGLLQSADFMGSHAAASVRRWVAHWRAMPRDEYLEICERL